MSRPLKEGLDYFPFEVDFFSDKKIKRLRARFGNDGVMVYVYILCEIYRNKGYYAEYDDDFALDISDELNISENLTTQIINYLFSRSLLIMIEGKLAVPVKAITASSVQRRFQKIKASAKRDVEVIKEFWVLEKNETESFIKVRPVDSFSGKNTDKSGKNGNNSGIYPLKERKGKERKEKENNNSACAEKPKKVYGEYKNVHLTDTELEKLKTDYGEKIIEEYIKRLDEYIEMKGAKYKNHNVAIRNWLGRANIRKLSEQPPKKYYYGEDEIL